MLFQVDVKVPRYFVDVFKFTILTRDTVDTGVWKYVTLSANSRIVLEGKEVVLILSLFKLFVMLREEDSMAKLCIYGGN